MVSLAYLVILVSTVIAAVGIALMLKKRLGNRIRTACYVNVLVQLPIVALVLIIGGVPHILKLTMVTFFLSGYYLSSRLPFAKLSVVDRSYD